MYYQPGKTHHGLRYDPFKSCVTARPIGWISTVGRDGGRHVHGYERAGHKRHPDGSGARQERGAVW